jgi:hypothetical protein
MCGPNPDLNRDDLTQLCVGLTGVEPVTSRLSGVRSNRN